MQTKGSTPHGLTLKARVDEIHASFFIGEEG